MKLLDSIIGPSSSGDVVLRLAEIPLSRTTKLTNSPGAVLGKDQSLWTGGQIVGGDDPNALLAGRQKFQVFREMRLSDPAVRSLDWMLRLPIRAADWSLRPASDDTPEDLLIADCLGWNFGLKVQDGEYRNALGRLSQTWKESTAQALFAITYGCMCEEIIWGESAEEWRDQDGDVHRVRPITRLAPRFPSTILDVDVDPKTGRVTEVRQDIADTRPIPGEKLAWYVVDPEEDIFGTSVLRPAWGPWKLKQGLMTGAAIGWDRWASGTPVVRYPRSSTAGETRANEIGRSLRTHERAWVALEADTGWNIEILNGSGSIADPTDLLRHYDAQIAMAGLQQFMSLGTTERGSRAVGDVVSKPYYEVCQAIADDLASARMRQVFRRWVDHNFGPQFDIPELVCTGIEADDIQLLASVLADLSSAGLTFTDAETQDDIRRRIKLRELPKAIADALEKLPENVGVKPVVPPGTPPQGEGDSVVAPPEQKPPVRA